MITLERDNNFTSISIGDNLEFYFSYKTCIAFRLCGKLTISENVWSTTTGFHLNYINSDHKIRIPHDKFEEALTKLIESIDARTVFVSKINMGEVSWPKT